jgi:hypothetical protein
VSLERLDGPAAPAEKGVYRALVKAGVAPADIPEQFQDSVIAKTRKGKLGQIVLKRISGLQSGAALRVVQKFEENVGGKEDVAEKLAAISGELTKEQRRLLDILSAGSSKKSLARVLAEAGAEPIGVMHAYARGALELGKLAAAIQCHNNLPAVAEELVKMSLSKAGICHPCGGSGKLHAKSSDHQDTEPCTFCLGNGVTNESKHKEFAISKLIDMEGLIKKEPAVQVAIGVKVGNGEGSVFTRMMKATDEVLYRKPASEQTIEAEVVETSPVSS